LVAAMSSSEPREDWCMVGRVMPRTMKNISTLSSRGRSQAAAVLTHSRPEASLASFGTRRGCSQSETLRRVTPRLFSSDQRTAGRNSITSTRV